MSKTVKEEIEGVRARKSGQLKGKFTMVDVPVHLVNAFCSDIKTNYGNIYWVKLMDLMRKAEAYDAMVQGTTVQTREEPIDISEDKSEEVKTMGGLR